MFPKPFSLDITGVNKLRIEGYDYTNDFTLHYLANVVVSNFPVSVAPELPDYIRKDSLVLGKDLRPYRKEFSYGHFGGYTILEYPLNGEIQMKGAAFSSGLSILNTNNMSPYWGGGSAYFNLGGKYTSMTGVYGPLAVTETGRCKISFIGDGKTLNEYVTIAGNEPQQFSIDITNVHQLLIEIQSEASNDRVHDFAVADIVISR
jgi:hypothetical protein